MQAGFLPFGRFNGDALLTACVLRRLPTCLAKLPPPLSTLQDRVRLELPFLVVALNAKKLDDGIWVRHGLGTPHVNDLQSHAISAKQCTASREVMARTAFGRVSPKQS